MPVAVRDRRSFRVRLDMWLEHVPDEMQRKKGECGMSDPLHWRNDKYTAEMNVNFMFRAYASVMAAHQGATGPHGRRRVSSHARRGRYIRVGSPLFYSNTLVL